MAGNRVETAIIIWGDRHFPASAAQDQCRALEASGVVDGAMFPDQLVNFIPRQLWKTDNTPMAKVMRDPDSIPDAFAIAPYAFAAAPSLNLTLSTDSIRRPPVELVQSMLTLANITEGRVNFHIGGGENKQCAPYGHNRSQGISRMEDLFTIFHLLLESDGQPVDFEGRRRTLTKAAIGSATPYRPKIWALGGGPKLVDHAATYADGLAATAPVVWTSGEHTTQVIADVRRQIASKDRDPDKFRFGLWFPSLVHDDPAVLERAFGNRLVKFMTAIFGRVTQTDWEKEGLTPPAGPDWNYFKDLLPYDTDDSFIEEAISRVNPGHIRKGWLIGSPKQVAEQMQPYVDAGVDWVMPLDYLPMISEPDDAEAGFMRSIDVCRALKQANPDA